MTASMTYEHVLDIESKWLPWLREDVQRKHPDYNKENGMLRRPFSSPGYHTTIKNVEYVHPILDSLDYALAILDSGDERYRDRAWVTLRNIVALQDQDPLSPTFGVWSWFWEEPLANMSPPDWNWADFIGKRLLMMLTRHGEEMPTDLVKLTEQAVRNSCKAIIKRNVGPDYTNIAIMGAFVTIIAGERLEETSYLEYGLQRLKRLYDYSMQTGTFLEYNSPTYSTVAVLELSALATYTRNAEARRLTNELIDATWLMIAERYHPLLKQWAGPHARSYHSFLAPTYHSFLYMACGGKVPLMSEEEFAYNPDWYGHGVQCPEKLFDLLTTIGVRELKQDLPPYHEFRTRTAYTYLTPDYALGTFNHNVMWNQCRNLLAYTRNGEGGSVYMRLRFLHDGYDFCSAVFKSEQKHGSVLFGIQFALDGGDTHVNLDPANGRIKASDLRIRFEVGYSGSGKAPEWTQNGADSYQAAIGETTLSVRSLFGAMSGYGPFGWEVAADEAIVILDYVIYHGDTAEIDFHDLEEALFLFAMTLSSKGESLPEATARPSSDAVQASLDTKDRDRPMTLSIARKPDLKSVLLHN